MFSVLYVKDNDVYVIGPFSDTAACDAAARKAQDAGEFDITETKVYCIDSKHHLIEYSMAELGVL